MVKAIFHFHLCSVLLDKKLLGVTSKKALPSHYNIYIDKARFAWR
jgi:hypothetical protein